MLKAVFFDLDGTLLPFDEEEFTKTYFKLLITKLAPLGFDPKKLITTLLESIKQMANNDGEHTNEEVFWQYFTTQFGEKGLQAKDIITEFYSNEFLQVKSICKENKEARKIIEYCKEKGLKVILATNPIFPKIATINRMAFVDLKEEDFDYITTYENSYFAKPDPDYFLDLLVRFDLKPNEVILFGNNEKEDGQCGNLSGIEVYLVGDYIIKDPASKKHYQTIALEDIIPTIERNL